MKSHWYAKIFGWSQFALQAVQQLAAPAGSCGHSWQCWLGVIASGATAVAVHAASNTDGNK